MKTFVRIRREYVFDQFGWLDHVRFFKETKDEKGNVQLEEVDRETALAIEAA